MNRKTERLKKKKRDRTGLKSAPLGHACMYTMLDPSVSSSPLYN